LIAELPPAVVDDDHLERERGGLEARDSVQAPPELSRAREGGDDNGDRRRVSHVAIRGGTRSWGS